VLVVDDNVDSASTMAMFLELSGYTVGVAHDGPEAVAAAHDFRPDVVLMDIGLPGMTGHEAGRAIRREPWGAKLVLIALSGWSQESDKQRSRDAGFNHHLVKPVEHTVLLRLLSQTGAMRDLGPTET
jgi:CheY-like chemotaxis protein